MAVAEISYEETTQEPEAPKKPSVKEFAHLIRQKRPEHKDLNDLDAVNMALDEHPQYLRNIDQQDYLREGLRRKRQDMFAEQPMVDRALAGTGKGMMDMYQGARQILPGVDADPEYAETAKVYEEAAEGDIPSMVGEIVGGTAATIPFGMGAGGLVAQIGTKYPVIANMAAKSPKIAKMLSNILPGMASGAAQAGAEFTDEDESRMQNALYGGMFGAGGQLATKIIGKFGAKGFNALKGKMKNATTQELIDLSNKFDIPLSFTDVSKNPAAREAENILEKIPMIGTGKFRKEGSEKATKAIKKVADDYRPKSGDTGSGIQEGIERKFKSVRETASKLYDDVERLSDKSAKPARKSISAVNKILREIDESDVPSSLKTHFEKILENLQRGDKTFKGLRKTRSDLGREAKRLQMSDPQGERYVNMLRSAVEKDMDDVATSAVKVGTFAKKGQRATKDPEMTEVFQSTGKDIVPTSGGRSVTTPKPSSKELTVKGTDLARQGENLPARHRGVKTEWDFQPEEVTGEFKNLELDKALKKANKFYREKVVPFREDKAIKAALKSNKPDEIFNTFIKRGKKDRAQNFFNALDEEGQGAVRYGMIEEAIEGAAMTGKEGLSPARFAKKLEDLKDARSVFFKGEKGKELEGFTKLMRAAERFGQYTENPPTGQRLMSLVLAGGAAKIAKESPVALVSGLATAQGLKILLTSKAGRNLLLASGKLDIDSPKMAKLLERATRILNGTPARASAKAGTADDTRVK